jgi:hypothetical protein
MKLGFGELPITGGNPTGTYFPSVEMLLLMRGTVPLNSFLIGSKLKELVSQDWSRLADMIIKPHFSQFEPSFVMTTECHRRRENPRKYTRRWIVSVELAR